VNSRERIRTIISGKPADRTGFWLGNPFPDSWPALHGYFGTQTEEELRRKVNDDFRWICPQFYPSGYRHPEGKPLSFRGDKKYHGQAGPFAHTEDLREVDAYDWPKVEYLNFEECLDDLNAAGEFYRASGMWTSFYHDVMDLFGIEDYLVKMYTHPKVVQSVTDHVCEFYYQANELFFERAGSLVDAFFFGNDFGTQRDIITSPKLFDQFILPWFRRFTEQGHRHGCQVILHSCGAIHRVIPRLIESGVDCLHPLQALARNMDAVTLARNFKGKIAFLGGIDTQDLLVNGSPEQVKEDVRRVRDLLGPCLIVSPSHEALLPDVPPQNVEAMAQAALE
jgi:uroporphyrinogen decarboxylase